MNIRSTIKTLPIIAALAIALAMSPNTAMADKGDRNAHKGQYSKQYSHDAGRSHNRTRKDTRLHKGYAHHGHGHKKVRKSHPDMYYGGHKHKGHHHRRHSHDHYVVHEHGYRDHYVDFDNLRFMIGLHTDQFDIIFRD